MVRRNSVQNLGYRTIHMVVLPVVLKIGAAVTIWLYYRLYYIILIWQ